jgi:hypothetical protein
MEARQEPTFEQLRGFDADTPTDGPMAAELASAFFGDPLPWQQHVLDAMIARDRHDKYLYHLFAMAVSRQNGKSWDARGRCFYGAVVEGENILYTCQHGDTADEMFADLSAPFEDDDHPELQELLLAVRKTNGQQCIKLKNGGRIRFTTRTNSLARGKTYDVIIYDEAQELTRAQQAASLPTISASPKKNTQVIYLGTPPDPDKNGFVFEQLHWDVHDGLKPNVAWIEWATNSMHDPQDRAEWYRCNPSLGTLLDETAIQGEADSMDHATFNRERLGWWAPRSAGQAAVDPEAWKDTEIDAIGRKFQGIKTFGVKFVPDGSMYALVGCRMRRDRSVAAVEAIDSGSTDRGTRKLAEWLAMAAESASVVVVDGANGASALCANLAELKVPAGYVVRPRPSDVAAAAQGFADALKDRSVRHTPSADLDNGAAIATKRALSGAWGYDGAPAIEAASLALWAARSTKRDPNRKQVIL